MVKAYAARDPFGQAVSRAWHRTWLSEPWQAPVSV
jgi:hypothetical protein